MQPLCADSGGWPLTVRDTAVAVLDGRGDILAWNTAATELLGFTADEVRGRSARSLLAGPGGFGSMAAGAGGPVRVRDRSGHTISVCLSVITFETPPLAGCPHSLILFSPVERMENQEWNDSLMRQLFTGGGPGVVVHGSDLRIRQADAGLGDAVGKRPEDVYLAEDADALGKRLRQVMETGEPLVDWEHPLRPLGEPDSKTVRSVTAFRLPRPDGSPMGVATLSHDVTAHHRSRRRWDLLHRAMTDIGVSLDMTRTAEALVGVLVPEFASWASVDLAAAVLEGEPLPDVAVSWPTQQRQAAMAQADQPLHLDTDRRARTLAQTPETERTRRLRTGRAVLTRNLPEVVSADTPTARFLRAVYPEEARSVIVAPLFTGDGLLGVLCMARTADMPQFDDDDLALVEELTPRAALNINNAWRFAREHRTAVALQRSLLPRTFARTTTAETAGTYRSADAGEGVGGDWYDTIPLSSLRTAFVMGDVVGHGLRATTMMGRLRTAVQSFAALDLDPGELLARVDDLVLRLAAEQEAAGDTEGNPVGGTCLYAVYDPVSHRCAVASAGHPPPALVPPDGEVRFVEVDPGPPLGVGGMPFETAEIDLSPGSVLAFYTNGLVGQRDDDPTRGMEELRRGLGPARSPGVALAGLGSRIVSSLARPRPSDDAALLLARVQAVSPADTVFWELPADESIVAEARGLVTGQLATWHLDELSFSAEMVTSELVTNAVRYAGGPIGLRLIRDSILVCEVTDTSDTQPRLRRARSTDEGGRGLFIVAQLVKRWGSRYGHSGKTIWVELELPGG
jgi:PAS domain-containing protein/anti-sigma regulatory factor (Ser/Thr protein kinase)